MGETVREYRYYADELEVECLISEARFADAKGLIDKKFKNSNVLSSQLVKKLARAIAYEPNAAPLWLREWAKANG